MDTDKPPPNCEQCGEPVFPGDEMRMVTATDESGIPLVEYSGIVHERCWQAFAETHKSRDKPEDGLGH